MNEYANKKSVKYNLRTAEYVSPKHPDKICDQISDAILDAHLAQDPEARVAVDVAGGHGTVFVVGEVTSKAQNIDIVKIVHRLAGDVEVIDRISKQSHEIARGVDIGGAGDQGVMIGYACDETPEHLPLEFVLARSLCMNLYKHWPHDGKTQVTTKDGKIVSVVASFQKANGKELREYVLDWLEQEPLVKTKSDLVELHINPAGDWDIGGFDADSGLTGRKLAVDNYGPRVPIGGGAFSGKDPSKVDRSAAYMARRIATDYLKKRNAHEVYVYLAYAIGQAEPLEATVIIDGEREEVDGYDLTPNGIIKFLDLKRPQYEAMARDGHFK
jgi:S-adenosylmethionine synthetase